MEGGRQGEDAGFAVVGKGADGDGKSCGVEKRDSEQKECPQSFGCFHIFVITMVKEFYQR